MKIGYVRVSKQEQHEELQIDALKEAGCQKWFVDKVTGAKAERKGLNEALAYLRPGDTFIMTNAKRPLPIPNHDGRGLIRIGMWSVGNDDWLVTELTFEGMAMKQAMRDHLHAYGC
jgi:Resolvase, N terminal domain